MSTPTLSVVIPSILRDDLPRAIASVRAQDHDAATEVIVVADLPADRSREAVIRDAGADHIIWTGGGFRGGHARNLGVRAAGGDYIAFLDDDDEWMPSKVSRQLELIGADSGRLASSRVEFVDRAQTLTTTGPERLIEEGERVEDYLFLRKPAKLARPSLYTSTFMGGADLVKAVPWAEGLRRHQDWDWLLALQEAGARFVQSADVLTRIWMNSNESISASPDWHASLEWAKKTSRDWRKSTIADFIAAHPMRYAMQARSFSGLRKSTAAIVRSLRVPSPGPLAYGLGGALPREAVVARLMKGR